MPIVYNTIICTCMVILLIQLETRLKSFFPVIMILLVMFVHAKQGIWLRFLLRFLY